MSALNSTDIDRLVNSSDNGTNNYYYYYYYYYDDEESMFTNKFEMYPYFTSSAFILSLQDM
ncbi:hypothetical protein ACF0H5_019535 [Mactra antiquata]